MCFMLTWSFRSWFFFLKICFILSVHNFLKSFCRRIQAGNKIQKKLFKMYVWHLLMFQKKKKKWKKEIFHVLGTIVFLIIFQKPMVLWIWTIHDADNNNCWSLQEYSTVIIILSQMKPGLTNPVTQNQFSKEPKMVMWTQSLGLEFRWLRNDQIFHE